MIHSLLALFLFCFKSEDQFMHTSSTSKARISPQGSVSLGDCVWVFPDEVDVSLFPLYVWTAQSAHSDLLSYNLPPALFAE